MKLACSTLIAKDWSAEHTARVFRQNGISAVELRCNLNDWSKLDMTAKQARDLNILFQENSLTVCDIASDVNIKGNEEEQIELFKKTLQLAEKLNSKAIRIFLGGDASRAEEIAETVKILCSLAAQYNIEVWIETHGSFSTAKQLKPVLDRIPEENCKVIWDIIHPIEYNEPFECTLSLLNRRISHIHIKDGKRAGEKWLYTRLGEGILPIRNIIHSLKDADYKGYYSLEWESPWRAELQTPECDGNRILPGFASYMQSMMK